MEDVGDVERRLPEDLEGGVALLDLERLHVDVGEAGLREQLAHALGVASAKGPGVPGTGDEVSPRSISSSVGSSAQGLCWTESHTASATRPPGRSTRRVSASAAGGSASSM